MHSLGQRVGGQRVGGQRTDDRKQFRIADCEFENRLGISSQNPESGNHAEGWNNGMMERWGIGHRAGGLDESSQYSNIPAFRIAGNKLYLARGKCC